MQEPRGGTARTSSHSSALVEYHELDAPMHLPGCARLLLQLPDERMRHANPCESSSNNCHPVHSRVHSISILILARIGRVQAAVRTARKPPAPAPLPPTPGTPRLVGDAHPQARHRME